LLPQIGKETIVQHQKEKEMKFSLWLLK